MLQHLINTTIIWLTALVFFDLLLRKETFHQANRFYLIIALLAGVVLPFAEINNIVNRNEHQFLSRPTAATIEVRNVLDAKSAQTIEAADTASGINIGLLLLGLYLAGVFVAIAIVAVDCFKLLKLFRSGTRGAENGYQLIETGKTHSPFSFFDTIFISARTAYSDEQWQLLIAHEREHGKRLHSLDNLLFIMLRIVFWFHPLVHLYYRRLRMIHEFQADTAAGSSSSTYGNFLVEQSILRNSPILTHRFNYSPIKNRIVMLTREKSAANRLLKYSATLPLVLLLVVFCTQTSFSGIRSGNNKVKFNGNEIEFGSLKVIPYEYRETMEQQKRLLSYTTLPDSVLIKDPLTGIQKWYTVKSDIMPVSINGQHIFGNEEQYMLGDAEKNYSLPVLDGSAKGIYEYLFNALKDDLDKLEDGGYALQVDKMVVDYDGKLAYYEVEGLRISMSSYERWPLIGQDLKQSIDNRLKKILSEQIRFKPAVKDGKPINVRTTPGSYEIIVKDHKARLAQIQGC